MLFPQFLLVCLFFARGTLAGISDFDCRDNGKGKKYMGTVQYTKTGKECQRWDEQEPHKHSYGKVNLFPESDLSDAENYCRNPSQHSGLWCYTTDPKKRWEDCEIPICKECRYPGLGKEYRGHKSVTKSGKTCQKWSSQSPHKHTRDDPFKFPDSSLTAANNYCRNPDDTPGGPWCYTTESSTRWEFCDIPICPGGEDCRSSGMGKEYAGTADVTVTGRPCQRWDKQTPHSHTRNNPSKFPDSSLEEASNYCRNPDDTAGGPWCYTIDENVRWEFCPIPICRQYCNECRSAGLGKDYRGTRSVTKTGKTCQKWSSQSPHKHTRNDPAKFPDSSLKAASNYCRNPDDENEGPWCYTTDSGTRWEYCDIPICPGS